MKYTCTGFLVKDARDALEMTQLELARKIGVHVQYISNIERGECPPPDAKLLKLLKVLGLKPFDYRSARELDFQNHMKEKYPDK